MYAFPVFFHILFLRIKQHCIVPKKFIVIFYRPFGNDQFGWCFANFSFFVLKNILCVSGSWVGNGRSKNLCSDGAEWTGAEHKVWLDGERSLNSGGAERKLWTDGARILCSGGEAEQKVGNGRNEKIVLRWSGVERCRKYGMDGTIILCSGGRSRADRGRKNLCFGGADWSGTESKEFSEHELCAEFSGAPIIGATTERRSVRSRLLSDCSDKLKI